MKHFTFYTLLLLAALLLAIPLAVPTPVQASRFQAPLPASAAQAAGTELVPGNYQGWIFLYADLATHQSASMGNVDFDFNVRTKWKTEGTVNVAVTGKDKATASLKLGKFTVSNTDNNIGNINGQNCNVYAFVLGWAKWTTSNDASYNKDDESFDFTLEPWGFKEYKHKEGSVGGSIKGCDERLKPRAIDAMELAVDAESEHWITALSLMVYEVGTDGSMSGKCLIPGFEGQTNIPNGYNLRTSTCNWTAFPVDKGKKGWW
jgi:hypothetical protein